MVKPYFDNVVCNKPKRKFLQFHDAYKLITNGCVHYCSMCPTIYGGLYDLVIYNGDLKYICETQCTIPTYRTLMKNIDTLYHYKEFLPF